jgi:hypothetical protein
MVFHQLLSMVYYFQERTGRFEEQENQQEQ